MPVDRETGSPPYIVSPVTGNKHSQTRALRIMARNQGWDPDVIMDSTTRRPVGSMLPWNKDPSSMWHDGVGAMPGGEPPDEYPDGFDAPTVSPGPIDWNESQNSGNEARRTSGADPTPGMPGA